MTAQLSEIDKIVMTGDLTRLTEEQKNIHYLTVCTAMELDYRLHPLEWMPVNDPDRGQKLVLYALRGATDQIRRNRKIKILSLTKEVSDELVTYIAAGEDADGITEMSTGSVPIKNKRGHDLANAYMTAETKAKRRLTLAFSGSGLLDETEVAELNAPMSMPAGVGVTATPSPKLDTPAPSAAAGGEVKLPSKEEPKKGKKADTAVAGLATLKDKKSPVADITESSQIPTSVEKQVESVENAEILTDVVEKQIVAQNTPDQGVLIQTSVEPTEPVKELTQAEAREKLNQRITVYKRDRLPDGGMRPQKGFGINAKFGKYFLIHYPDRNTSTDLTNEEIEQVLGKLDAIRVEAGDAGLVKAIEEAIA